MVGGRGRGGRRALAAAGRRGRAVGKRLRAAAAAPGLPRRARRAARRPHHLRPLHVGVARPARRRWPTRRRSTRKNWMGVNVGHCIHFICSHWSCNNGHCSAMPKQIKKRRFCRSPNPAASPATNAQERARHHEGDKNVTATFENRDGGGRVWTWLTNRRTPSGPPQLSSQAPTTPAENHYTLDEAYTTVGEALYAELDRESSSSPAYQNTAYNGSDTDPDAPPSSAPSSAYYSDLSCATAPDRTYEAVGVAVNTNTGTSWETGDVALRRHPIPRLAAITETITVPSDYV